MYLLLSFACALTDADTATGDDPVVTEDADTDTDTDTDPDGDAPVWAEVFPLLETRCGGCHESDYIGHFIVVGDAAATYSRLLEEPALQDDQRRYVVPGDLETSLLIEKIGPAPGLGETMPPAGAPDVMPLSVDEVGLIERWVYGGARQ